MTKILEFAIHTIIVLPMLFVMISLRTAREKYLDIMKQQYPIQHIEMTPEYYLGNNIEIRENNTIKINSLKCIKEIIEKYEKKYGELRK